MDTGIVQIIFDTLIIVLLAGTIFVAARLSLHLKTFRDSRKDFEKIMADMGRHIEKAEKSVQGLRAAADEAGKVLQDRIREAQDLSGELEIMTQSADRLGERLEKLTTNGRAVAREKEQEPPPAAKTQERGGRKTARAKPKPFAFAIRDPEIEGDYDCAADEAGLLPGDYDDDGDEESRKFQTSAERDLYEALRQRGKTGAGGVG